LSAEQQIVAKQLKAEFEQNGIHLTEEKRKQVVLLQSKIGHLSYEFGMLLRNGESSVKVLEVDLTRLKGLSPDLIKRLPKYSIHPLLIAYADSAGITMKGQDTRHCEVGVSVMDSNRDPSSCRR